MQTSPILPSFLLWASFKLLSPFSPFFFKQTQAFSLKKKRQAHFLSFYSTPKKKISALKPLLMHTTMKRLTHIQHEKGKKKNVIIKAMHADVKINHAHIPPTQKRRIMMNIFLCKNKSFSYEKQQDLFSLI